MSRVFDVLADAKKAADSENAKPVAEGKQRNPFKVYKLVAGTVEKYAIGQTPTAAVGVAYDSLGVTVTREDHEALMPVNDYLSKLTSEELEAARAILAAKV